MKKESRTQQNKESLSNKQPVDPRANPFARIRDQTPVVSASNQKRVKPADAVRRKQLKLKGEQ